LRRSRGSGARTLWELHRNHTLLPRVFAEAPLAEAARAHQIIESRRNLGKVVLVPKDPGHRVRPHGRC
jgi:NADPH:quinone reductase-like Zn-dependent oxidoreductase